MRPMAALVRRSLFVLILASACSGSGRASIPQDSPRNSGPESERSAAGGLVVLRIEGCLEGYSTSTEGIRARHLRDRRYRVYLFKLKDPQGDDAASNYDTSHWLAVDVDVSQARNGGIPGVAPADASTRAALTANGCSGP